MTQPQLFEDDSIRESTLPPISRERTYNGKSLQGMADFPGTGPDDQTCGTCGHRTVVALAGRYQKCELKRDHWTGGAATDIKVYFPACSKWIPMPEAAPKAEPGEYRRSEEEWLDKGGLR